MAEDRGQLGHEDTRANPALAGPTGQTGQTGQTGKRANGPTGQDSPTTEYQIPNPQYLTKDPRIGKNSLFIPYINIIIR